MQKLKLIIFALFALTLSVPSMAAIQAVDIPFGADFSINPAGDMDTFTFTAPSTGYYTFYSDNNNIDLEADLYSDAFNGTGTANFLEATDDDGCGKLFGDFFISTYLRAGDYAVLEVSEYDPGATGNYSVHGLYTTGVQSPSNYCDPASGRGAPDNSDSGAFSLPAILFTILGLGAVRLRRFFA